MAGIYVHIPFCTAKCAYCDFYSVARRDMADGYIAAVGREFEARRHELGDGTVDTLYFGGGTPSLLSPEQFAALSSFFDKAGIKEFTIEVNPDDVTDEKIDAWLAAGVNRISIGVQSLCDDELRAVGRRHDARQALDAIAMLASKGIVNISGDLIYGLPGQTVESFTSSLRRLIGSGITHLSAYSLSYEEGTLLWRRLQEGRVVPASEDLTVAMYTALCRQAREAGFEHYEISNFALPSYRSRHNSSYWREVPYLGLGPGAHSFDCEGVRRYVPSDVRMYIRNDGLTAVVDDENDCDRANDRIMVSLRTAEGLDLSRFSAGQQREIISAAGPWIESGDLVPTARGYAVKEASWLVSDAIIRDLLL